MLLEGAIVIRCDKIYLKTSIYIQNDQFFLDMYMKDGLISTEELSAGTDINGKSHII